MKKLFITLCLLVSCSQLQAEDVGYASEINLNRENQQKYGILIKQESAGWPDEVLLFKIVCPSTRENERFYQMSIDLVKERDGYYFRTSIMTFNENGTETGYFQINKSKIKECKFRISYKDNNGVHIIYIVDLKSYLEQSNE